ncbi:MAG: helix-turn-helix transcriptional regulator [Thiohalocapsa sp.]
MNPNQAATFGAYISEARKRLQMSQKELASRILREEDQKPISPQYLNDIERDRRNPSSDFLLRQFADVLQIDADYLHYLAGRLPDEIRRRHLSEEDVREAFTAFRRTPQKR